MRFIPNISALLLLAGCHSFRGQSEEKSRSLATSDNTYFFTYNNHQWNGFTVTVPGQKIVIETPAGDDANPSRNVTFGGRPNLIYNGFKVGVDSENAAFAVWPDTPGVTPNSTIFCKRISELVNVDTATFPKQTSDFFADFSIESSLVSATCPFQIQKPFSRPSWEPGTFMPTGDLLCVFSPRTLAHVGPKLVTLYVPFKYSETPFERFMNEWPQEKIDVCIDGVAFAPKEKKETEVDPVEDNTPDFRISLANLDELVELSHRVNGIPGVKYLFDRVTAEDKIYFQNSIKFDFHLPFINTNVPRFHARLSSSEYERLLFSAMPKDITGGELYWSESAHIPGRDAPGVLGFTVYYKTTPLIDEIKTTFAKLKASTPFAAEKIVFLFEKQQDYFRYRNALQAAGVPSLPMNALQRTP
jgi:hypothetical protein